MTRTAGVALRAVSGASLVLILLVHLANPGLAADLVLIGTHPTSSLTAYPTIHTLRAFEGRLYMGYGDWDFFPAVNVVSFDPVASAFHLDFPANTDSIGIFREIGGTLYVPHIDPGLYADSADYSFRTGGVWRDAEPLGMLHVFDMATVDGSDLWLVGSKLPNETAPSGPAVFRSVNGGRDWQDLTIPSTVDTRYFWGFPLRGRFYVRDTYYQGNIGIRTAAAPYRHFNRATPMSSGTNDFVVGVTGWVSGIGAPLPRLLVTYDTQAWRDLRGGNIVYHFTVAGSNIFTLETSGTAKALWMASAVTPSQAQWQRLDFNNVPSNAKAIEVLDDIIYVADTLGQLWAGRLDGAPIAPGTPTVVNESPDDFGRALSFDGDVLAIGAPEHSGDTPLCGQVTIWQRRAGDWSRTGTLNPPSASFSGWFGKALAIESGHLAVVEAGRDLSRGNRGSSAQIHLYEKAGDDWIWRRTLDHPYAQSVAITSNWLAVAVGGVDNATNFLSLYRVLQGDTGLEVNLHTNITVVAHPPFQLPQGFWLPTARVILDQDLCVFGSIGDSDFYGGPGEVQVYQRNAADVWQLQQVIHSPSPIPAGLALPPDRYGFSIALHNGWLAVGAPRDDTSALQAGAVHLYERTNGPGGNASFILRQTLPSPLNEPEAAFGVSVALNNSTLLVGSPGTEANAERYHGAVFVFRRSQSGWNQATEITPPSEPVGGFGTTVAFGASWLGAGSSFVGSSTKVTDRVTLWPFGPPEGELSPPRQIGPGSFELMARGAIGRTYSLLTATELPAGNWTDLFEFTLITPATNVLAPVSSAPQRFYRLASEADGP